MSEPIVRRRVLKQDDKVVVEMDAIVGESNIEAARRHTFPDTPDDLFEVEKNYTQAEEDLIKFVEKQIDLMNSNLLFGGQSVPSFYSLNKSLMDFESIMLGLIALHQECRVQFDIAKEKYDDFYAEKYVEVKTANINLSKAVQYTAAREIEMFVRKQWLKELSKLKAEIIKTENKYNTVNHMISAWEKYAFILNTLSKNAQAEAGAAGIASKNPKEFSDD